MSSDTPNAERTEHEALAPAELPTSLYKIIPASLFPPHNAPAQGYASAKPTLFISSAIPAALPLSSLDENDGFIHLSTLPQTASTADLYYSSKDTLALYIARVDYQAVRKDIRWEMAGSRGQAFGHLYNGIPPRLGSAEIVEVKLFKRASDEKWSQAFEEQGEWWFKY